LWSLHADRRRLEAELEGGRSRYAQLQDDLNRSLKENEWLRSETNEMLNSRSWRFTGPIRAISHSLRTLVTR
jgi:hypothetical protein